MKTKSKSTASPLPQWTKRNPWLDGKSVKGPAATATPASPGENFSPKWEIALLLSRDLHFTRSIIHGIAQMGRAQRKAALRLSAFKDTELDATVFSQQWSGAIGMISQQSVADAFARHQVPLVNVSNFSLNVRIPRVVSDDLSVGAMGADHFLGRGFASFTFCGAKGHGYAELRQKGFCDTITAAGLPCASQMLDWRFANALVWIKKLAQPAAIMASNDTLAVQIIDYCVSCGLRVPEDVAVLGVDDDQTTCEFSPVPVSSVQLNGERIGGGAMSLLLRLMAGDPPPSEPILIPPRGVIVRQSTDVVAIADEQISSALKYMRDHLTRPLKIEDLLLHVHMSRRAFEQRFRRVVGKPPYAEILRMRIDRVKELLRNSSLSITQVAHQCGFTKVRDLSTIFRKRVGMTPKDYRQQNREYDTQDAPEQGG